MEEFVFYDKLRLQSFMNNPQVKDVIKIVEDPNLVSLKFPYVDYFNYTQGKLESSDQINKLISFYQEARTFKILVDDHDDESRDLVEESGSFALKNKICKTTACKSVPYGSVTTSISFEPVREENVETFTSIYLRCFNAENRHPDSLETNFRLKVSMPGSDFYIIYWNHKPVGICGLYHSSDFTLLSVGGVLPAYRFLGIHKAALAFRLSKAFDISPNYKVHAWAYEGSISLSNMIKVGMLMERRYWEYEYVA